MGSPLAALTAEAQRAFRTLPDRYLGAEEGFDATWHVRLGDIGQTWEVRCTTHGARVRRGITRRRPDVTIGTDAATWLALRAGDLSGIEAFSQRSLYARGNTDLAAMFEGLFRLPCGRDPLVSLRRIKVDSGLRISTLTMGNGPDVMLLHGLGGTKASFFDTAAALSRAGYRVHALDLPGFGSSSKPALAQYGAPFAAKTVLSVMDALGIGQAHVVGNSMGGRVALEVALSNPERVGGLGLLCPAVAFVRRDFHPLVRVLRPELALLPHSIGRATIEKQFWSLFADPDQVDPSLADVVCDEFQRIYASAGARMAFAASARALYLDRPFGKGGFYERLAGLEPPALFVWASHDRLIPAGFRKHVARALPNAEQIVLDGCGHVPQVEQPERTNALLKRFLSRVDALGRPRANPRLSRAA
jgi:pimeloyl-ACP methyl ester carboxylesterase